MMQYIRLLRVHQWIKNLFLFVPAFFDQQLLVEMCLQNLIAGFIAFSFVSSAVYILNDYKDVNEDRMHPLKMFRPLASGTVPVSHAFMMFGVLLITGIGFSLYLHTHFFGILLLYFFMNIFYNFGLKHVPILDIFIVALGFVFRVVSGGILCNIDPSAWLIMITFLLALFIALAKRRDDVLLFLKSGHKTRKAIDGYNLEFLNISMGILASVVIVAYLMYTLSPEVTNRLGTEYMYITVVFVVLGIFRYLQRAFVEDDTGSPMDIIYRDRFIQITLLAWAGVIFFLLYFV